MTSGSPFADIARSSSIVASEPEATLTLRTGRGRTMTTAGDPKQKDDGSGGKYGPRLTYAEREAYANSTIPRSGGALDDPRAVQAFILLGWIPPLITAAISSVIVGFRTAASAHSPPC